MLGPAPGAGAAAYRRHSRPANAARIDAAADQSDPETQYRPGRLSPGWRSGLY